jgi:hypothetical protein
MILDSFNGGGAFPSFIIFHLSNVGPCVSGTSATKRLITVIKIAIIRKFHLHAMVSKVMKNSGCTAPETGFVLDESRG